MHGGGVSMELGSIYRFKERINGWSKIKFKWNPKFDGEKKGESFVGKHEKMSKWMFPFSFHLPLSFGTFFLLEKVIYLFIYFIGLLIWAFNSDNFLPIFHFFVKKK